MNYGKIEENKILLKHFDGILVFDINKCYSECYLNDECKAASFKSNEQDYCYFYDRLKSNLSEIKNIGWISYVKDSINFDQEKFKLNIKYRGHFKRFLVESRQECFNKCNLDNRCDGASIFSKPNNCFFYRQDFIEEKKIGWTSFIKTPKISQLK